MRYKLIFQEIRDGNGERYWLVKRRFPWWRMTDRQVIGVSYSICDWMAEDDKFMSPKRFGSLEAAEKTVRWLIWCNAWSIRSKLRRRRHNKEKALKTIVVPPWSNLEKTR